MRRIRVIPVLQYQNQGLVKTVNFKNPSYVGDPINAVKIFNEKEVDELAFIDISATRNKKEPNYDRIREITEECFMPLAYGGGITTTDQIQKILSLGVEKIILNSSAITNEKLVQQAAALFGSQSIVVSIDVKKKFIGGYKVHYNSGEKSTSEDPITFACRMEQLGAGELIVNSIDRDGTYKGYDIDLLKSITSNVSIPVIALGGANNVANLLSAVNEGGASAVAAGSLFVFHGPHRAVLINYPDQQKLVDEFYKKLN
ncbi:MAG: imidazole glycerol phosphate synthase subunit HisF [Bacteroidetes bacterium]|nr:imidazole glycerol phosphate synthase subunit HisF [Bacteroidota bacterium]